MEYRNQWESKTNSRYSEGMQMPTENNMTGENYSAKEEFPISSGSDYSLSGMETQGMGRCDTCMGGMRSCRTERDNSTMGRPEMERNEPFMRRERPEMERNEPFMRRERPEMERNEPFMRMGRPEMERNDPPMRMGRPEMERNEPFMRMGRPEMERYDPTMRMGSSNMAGNNSTMGMENPRINYEFSEMEPNAPRMGNNFRPTNERPSSWGMNPETDNNQRTDTPLTNRNISPRRPEIPELGPINPNPGTNDMVQNHAQVRILNTVKSTSFFHITIGNAIDIPNMSFADVSNYEGIPEGYQTVTISRVEEQSEIRMVTQSVPLVSGERSTLVIVNTANGLEIVHLGDIDDNELLTEMGSLRMANMTSDNSEFDVVTNNGEAAFIGLRFMENTTYKQSQPGDYNFHITKATEGTIQAKAVIENSELNSSEEIADRLLTFSLDIEAGSRYTAFILGNSEDLRMIIL